VGAAEQASSKTGSYARIRRNAGKAHFSVEPRERRFLVKQDTAISAKFSQSNRSLRHLTEGTLSFLEGIHKGDTSTNSELNMKAVYVFNLTVLTGFAAIGLLAAEAAHAQAPSGPITAAPSQACPRKCGECSESGTAGRAAHYHSWRLEVQPGR